jgi:FkbM family methyltransferase
MAGAQHLVFEELEEIVTPDDGTVIDVGAERGDVSRLFARLGFDVVAIEPEASNFEVLSKLRRIRAIRAVLSDRRGQGYLQVDPESRHHRLAHERRVGTESITMVTPDDVFRALGINRISVFKVDVEGYEPAVLRGLFASDVSPVVVVSTFTAETIAELLEVVGPHYQHQRFICRWPEAEGVSYQIRTAIIDGPHPIVFGATGGDLICSHRSLRHIHPLNVDG